MGLSIQVNGPSFCIAYTYLKVGLFFAATRLRIKCHFEASCHQSIAPIVAAARCFVSVMGRQ
ncbi:MAG: hypothetical protein WCL14_09435, partial [Bacteroidota bacterium]